VVLSDRFFFLSCRVLPTRRNLSESEFATLAHVIWERRKQHEFLLTAWVFVFEPGQAGLGPRPDDWKWSSVHNYTGTVRAPAGAGSPIPVERISLPADPRTRI